MNIALQVDMRTGTNSGPTLYADSQRVELRLAIRADVAGDHSAGLGSLAGAVTTTLPTCHMAMLEQQAKWQR
jgi:hypothetical protein